MAKQIDEHSMVVKTALAEEGETLYAECSLSGVLTGRLLTLKEISEEMVGRGGLEPPGSQ